MNHIDDKIAINAYCRAWPEARQHLARVPDYMHGGIARYIMWGIMPGDFLSAVVRSDLFAAARHGDEDNLAALISWVRLLYNAAPAAAFGSDRLVQRWHEMGGQFGKCIDCKTLLELPGRPETALIIVQGGALCHQCAHKRADEKRASQLMGG